MAKVSYESGKGAGKKELIGFRALYTPFKTLINNLTAQQKQDTLTIMSTGWAGATTAQKVEALRVCVALGYVMLGYLLWKEFGE